MKYKIVFIIFVIKLLRYLKKKKKNISNFICNTKIGYNSCYNPWYLLLKTRVGG